MSLNTVTVTWDETDIAQVALGGYVSFRLSATVADSADGIIIHPDPPKTYFFSGGSGSSAPLVANDNASLAPAGTHYTVTIAITGQQPYSFAAAVNYANGATQSLSYLLANAAVPVTQYASFLPLPAGSPVAGQVPAVAANGSSATNWTTLTAALTGALATPSGTPSAGQMIVATGTGTATRWSGLVLTAPLPSGDTTGATDGPALQAMENALNAFGGGTLLFQPGTYWGTLVKQSNTIWQGAGPLSTILKPPNGANADVVQGANFPSLTLGGTTGGITAWSIRDLCIDGNKANQSGTSYGLRVYGYNFEVANVIIRNCLTDGLYTEWAANSGGVTDGMEPRYRSIKIHNCGGNGWHDRGPHDARSWDVTIWANSTAGKGYWAESTNNTTVAAGSNGVDLSTFTAGSPGTLNVATTLNFPAASISATQGALTVTTALGAVTLTYTGTTATSFTGCVAQGSPGVGSTVSTGAAVAYVGGFSAAGQLHTQMHVYAQPMYDYVLDTQVHLVDCIGEVTQTGGAAVLIRSANCMLTGGLYVIYSGAPQVGAGIQLGDAANAASACRLDTSLGGFAGASAATAALNIVFDGGFNSIDLLVNQTSGTTVFGTPQKSSRVRVHSTGSGAIGTDTANSMIQAYGTVAQYLPSGVQQAWTLAPSSAPSNPAVNYRPPSNRWEFGNGITTRWFTDNLSTPSLDINAANGHILPRSGTSGSLTPSVVNGTYGTGTPTISANASDTAGLITMTVNGSPGAGSLIQLNYKNAFANHPIVIITPANAATAAIQAYVTSNSGNFIVSAAVAPPPNAVLSWNYVVLGQDS